MSFATDMTRIATQLISHFGEAMTFSRAVKDAYDPSTGRAQTTNTITFSARCAPENYKKTEIDGQLVQRGDVKLTVYKTSQVPEVGDIVTFNGADWRVIDVYQVRAQGMDVIYELQVRQ